LADDGKFPNTIRRDIEKMPKIELVQEYGKQDVTRLKWMHIWDKIEHRFQNLPKWAQGILLKDLSATVESNVAKMKKDKN
jgi:hypothetical protein